MHYARRSARALAALGVMVMISGPLVGLLASPALADPPPTAEAAAPATLTFPVGGGSQYANISVERNAHIRNATLHLQGSTVPRDVPTHLNATSVAGGRANAWAGYIAADTPVGPVEAFIGGVFDAGQVANASDFDGAVALSPADLSNHTYQLFVFQVSALDIIELRAQWSGYALGGFGPAWTGRMFLHNFTSEQWQLAGSFPANATGVQNISYSSAAPANFIRAGAVAIMIVAGVPQSDVATDFVEVTTVVGVFPRPAIDVGDDGTYDWRFDAPGFGGLGRQTEFEDGSELARFDFPVGGGSFSKPLLIPPDAEISDAGVIVRAFPASASNNSSGTGVSIAGAGQTSLGITGLPNNSRGDAAFVVLRNVTTLDVPTHSNMVAQAGEIRSGSDPNGYRKAGQSFNVTKDGPLSRISVYVVQFQGNPGPLVATLRTANATGFPTSTVLANWSIPQSALAASSWIDFVASGPALVTGQWLVLEFSMPTAPPDTASNYVTLGTSTGDQYSDGESLSYFNVTSVGESWSKPSGADLLFRIGQDQPTTSIEGANLRAASQTGTFSQVSNRSTVSFAIDSPTISNQSTTIQVSNQNNLTVVFNWTLRVDYSQVAEDLRVTVGNASTQVYFNPFLSEAADIPIESALQAFLDSGSAPVVGFGSIPLAVVEFNFSATTIGSIEVASIDIRYTVDLPAQGFASELDALLWSLPNDQPRVDLPLRVYSPGAANLTFSSISVLYDRPPEFFGFPAITSDEDVPLTFDLNSVFHDDFDNANLSFTFLVISGGQNAQVVRSGPYNLTITPAANWSGDVVVNVLARDSLSLSNSSGDVTFSFLPVNDPPALTTNQLNVTWGAIFQVDLTPFLVDADTPTSSAIVSSVGTAPISFSGRTLIFDAPVGAPDFFFNLTLSDGDAEGTYAIRVHPRASDTIPIINPLPSLVIPHTGAWRLNLSLYFSDVEDAIQDLSFTLRVSAGNASSFTWMIEDDASSRWLKLIPRAGATGAVTAQLEVRDRDGNLNVTTLGFQLVPPPNQPPQIVALPPAVALFDGRLQIFLVTKFYDAEDGDDPLRVTWTITAQDGGVFDWSYDAHNQTLELRPRPGAHGRGTISLELTDSGGANDTAQIQVTVDSSAPAPGALTRGEAAGVLVLFFGTIVLLSAISIKRDAQRHSKKGATAKRKPAKRPPPERALEEMKEETPAAGGEAATDDMADFLRGLEGPAPDASAPPQEGEVASPQEEEGVVTLGVKSGLESKSAFESQPLAAPAPASTTRGPPRLKELYLFSLKDGTLLTQIGAKDLRALTQEEENEFLQFAFDQARSQHKGARKVDVMVWREWRVVVARGSAFFLAGRITGEGDQEMGRALRPIIEEVDHNFPGTVLDWQRTDVLDAVVEVFGRLVK